MGNFKVAFSQKVPFNDPEYRFVDIEVKGEAEVSCAEREGNENDVNYVQTMIQAAIQDQIFKLDDGKTSYKELPAKAGVLGNEAAAALGVNSITILSFAIASIAPDAKSQERITQLDKTKAFTAMSPAEQMKMMEEANKRAQEELSKLSADQRRQAEEQAKKIMEQQAADMKKIMEQVNQMKVAAGGTATAAAASEPTAPAPAQSPFGKRKFCSKCGAPIGNGKFCGQCGNPL
ncbi:MAG: hypothetical protein J5623_03660 [Clostridiales bacterium]|nr:hypothetical protein [Clostridiales bacterium]